MPPEATILGGGKDVVLPERDRSDGGRQLCDMPRALLEVPPPDLVVAGRAIVRLEKRRDDRDVRPGCRRSEDETERKPMQTLQVVLNVAVHGNGPRRQPCRRTGVGAPDPRGGIGDSVRFVA